MKKHLVLVLKAIAAITVLSGMLQMIKPQFVLGIISDGTTPAGNHFFGIVGMFMVLFGGMLWQALRSSRPQPLPVFWCGLQKLGASVAVGVGFSRDLFSWLALGVAGFDLMSAVLIFVYWMSIRQQIDRG